VCRFLSETFFSCSDYEVWNVTAVFILPIGYAAVGLDADKTALQESHFSIPFGKLTAARCEPEEFQISVLSGQGRRTH
jgi:hypothetical protein